MKTRIQRIGVLQSGKIAGLLYTALAVVILPFAVIGLMGEPNADKSGAVALIVMGLLYPILGFIGGIIFAFLYNVIAGWIGGLEMDLENQETTLP